MPDLAVSELRDHVSALHAQLSCGTFCAHQYHSPVLTIRISKFHYLLSRFHHYLCRATLQDLANFAAEIAAYHDAQTPIVVEAAQRAKQQAQEARAARNAPGGTDGERRRPCGALLVVIFTSIVSGVGVFVGMVGTCCAVFDMFPAALMSLALCALPSVAFPAALCCHSLLQLLPPLLLLPPWPLASAAQVPASLRPPPTLWLAGRCTPTSWRG
jgi:hypothetical protein